MVPSLWRLQSPLSRLSYSRILSSRNSINSQTQRLFAVIPPSTTSDEKRMADNLKARTRDDYGYFLTYRTRWSDNDQYSHMNNSIYYHLFDSIVNTYLIEQCGQNPKESPLIGLVVSSYAQFFAPVGFPQVLDLGLRVNKLGSSSVTYEVGVFEQEKANPAAVGGYTHVFVGSESRKSTPMAAATREGLGKLCRAPAGEKPKL